MQSLRTTLRVPILASITLSLGALALTIHTTHAETLLSLDQYLGEVSRENPAALSANLASEAKELQSEETSLLLRPTLFGEGRRNVDEKKSAFFSTNRTTVDIYSLGVSQNTPIGLQAKLLYGLDKYTYESANPLMGPNPPKFFEGRPQIELTQSLWKNGFGDELRSSIRAGEEAALSGAAAEKFKKKSVLSSAETSYWRLALARETLKIHQSTLNRAVEILAWSARRAKLGLSDESDALQAEAGKIARELDFQRAMDDERSARLEFNDRRNRTDENVPELLEPIHSTTIAGLTLPTRAAERYDVVSARHAELAQNANLNLAKHRNNPTLDLFGTYAFNSKELGSGEAISQSFESTYPYWELGLRFSTTMDFWTRSDVLKGFQLEQEAASATLSRTVRSQETEWTDLVHQFSEAQKRLLIASRIEAAQLKKLEYEQGRLKRGRTTTYQVLLFEQDYSGSALSRLGTQAEILKLIARAKLFTAGGSQ